MTNPAMNRVLTTPILIVFGLAYMVPLGIFTTYGQVTVLSSGHLPIAYIITLVMIFFTALSYCRMSTYLPLSGSAYSYTQRTFGPIVGFSIGWVQILDYLFLPIVNYVVLGLYLHEAFPMIPAWGFILASLISVTALNYIGVKLITPINLFLISLQVIFIGLFVFLSFKGADLSPRNLMEPLTPHTGELGGLLSGAAVLCLAFLGFDAIATMAEETKNASKTLPRAIMLTVAIAGAIFLVVSFAANISYPEWQDFLDPSRQDTASLDIMERVGEKAGLSGSEGVSFGGKLLADLFLAAYLTGVYASAMTSQTSVSRILFAMGREGVLPRKIFYTLHPKFNTPHLALICVATFSLISLFIPLSLVVSMISFGALVAFTSVNACVIKSHLFTQLRENYNLKGFFSYGLLPLIGMSLTIWLWLSLDSHAMTIGLIWFGLGISYLIYITRFFKYPVPEIGHDEIEEIIRAREEEVDLV